MDLALDISQWLICHKTQTTYQPTKEKNRDKFKIKLKKQFFLDLNI